VVIFIPQEGVWIERSTWTIGRINSISYSAMVRIVLTIKPSAMVKFTDACTYIVLIFIQQEGVD